MLLNKFMPLLLGLAIMVPSAAFASPGENDTESTMVRRPPPAYRPVPRPYYRPAPRRVYVAPTYAPRPRRAVESPYTPFFHFGLGIHGTSVTSDDDLTNGLESGGGFDLSFGWRLAPRFSLDFNWMMSFHDAGDSSVAGNEAALSSLSMDGRFFLADRSRQTQPYILAGVGAYILGRDSWEFDTLTGAGFHLGGGVDFYLSRYVSVGGKVLFRSAYLDNASSTWSQFPTESAWLTGLSYGGDIKFHF